MNQAPQQVLQEINLKNFKFQYDIFAILSKLYLSTNFELQAF